MHLSAPRNRYMHTMASKGRMLWRQDGDKISERHWIPLRSTLKADGVGREGGGGGLKRKRGSSPFHEVDHVDDARRADHGLVGEDGPHGLFHAELWLQRREKGFDFLPEGKEITVIIEKGIQGKCASNLVKLIKFMRKYN